MNNEPQFLKRVAIITGGGDGLGLALARRLASSNLRTVLWDVQGEKLDRAVAQLPGEVMAQRVDVTSPTETQAAAAEVVRRWGRIDILVNCAGITGRTNLKTHEVSPEDFERVFRVNVCGTLFPFQAVISTMLKQDYGRVLNVASIAGKEGNAGMLAYSTSKAAVIGMTKVQGKEYATTGVRINALAPAVIRTEMVAAMPDEQVAYMTTKIPQGRCGTLEEFAAMAAFIVSDENSFSTGFTFDLSGGRAVY